MGPDLRSILFDALHQCLGKTDCIAWNSLNSEAIQLLSISQIVSALLEGSAVLYGS